jgi:hypothetical protein
MPVDRSIETESDREALQKLIAARKIPFTITLTDGKRRSLKQNRLQREWVNQISMQMGDRTAEEVRGYIKLVIGIPILRNENEAFAEEYDRIIKPLAYETKLKLMMVPFDFGVTRLMTTKQLTAYLDEVYKHFTAQGVQLTMPDDLRFKGYEKEN